MKQEKNVLIDEQFLEIHPIFNLLTKSNTDEILKWIDKLKNEICLIKDQNNLTSK